MGLKLNTVCAHSPSLHSALLGTLRPTLGIFWYFKAHMVPGGQRVTRSRQLVGLVHGAELIVLSGQAQWLFMKQESGGRRVRLLA